MVCFYSSCKHQKTINQNRLKLRNGTVWKVSVFGVFLVRIVKHSDWIRLSPSVFSPNVGKYGTGKLRIQTILTQCGLKNTFEKSVKKWNMTFQIGCDFWFPFFFFFFLIYDFISKGNNNLIFSLQCFPNRTSKIKGACTHLTKTFFCHPVKQDTHQSEWIAWTELARKLHP